MSLRGFADGRLFAEVDGEGGPLIVLLHGWGRDRKDLLDVVAGLPGTAVSFDLPGFGSSPTPPTAWGTSDYAGLVARGVNELRNTAGDQSDLKHGTPRVSVGADRGVGA